MHNPRSTGRAGGRSAAASSSASRGGRGARSTGGKARAKETEQLRRETWEMEARLREVQAKVEQERSNMHVTKAGGPRWAAASTSRGPITNYAKQVLSTAEPAAQQRAERQHRLRQQQANQALGLQSPHSAAVPPAVASDPVPSLRLPHEAPAAPQQRPQSARGTVAGGLQPHKANLWSTADVGQWLESLGLARYVPTFDENEISGAILVDITAEDLDYLDVKVLAHRKLLLKGVTKLSQAVETGDASGMALPTPRSPPAHAYRMAPEEQQKQQLAVGAETAASPVQGANMVHWSALQPLAPQTQPEGGPMSVQGAPAQSTSLASMAYGEYDEAAEQAAFREAVMAWRGGGGSSPGSALAAASTGGGGSPAEGGAAWSNPADAPAPSSSGGRFASSLGAQAAAPSGAFSSTLGGAAQAAPARTPVAISRTADAGSSTATAAQGVHTPAAGPFNPLLVDGPDEAAEHAAFRDAVLAWRGEPGPSRGSAASGTAAAQASHGSGGDNLAAPNASLGAEAAKALGVDPSTVESSTWYAGYKTLFAGEGGAGGVQAFNEHVRALHEAKRKEREGASQCADDGSHMAAAAAAAAAAASAAGGQGGGGGSKADEGGGGSKADEGGEDVTSPTVAVVEEGGVTSFVQARVTTSRGGSRAAAATVSSPEAGGGASGGVGGADSKESEIEDMDDLLDAPQAAGGADGLISLVDFSALDGLAPSPEGGGKPAAAPQPAQPSPQPGTQGARQGAVPAPRDIWSVDFDY